MTVTVPTTSNQPAEFALRRLQDLVVAQTTYAGSLVNGSPQQNDANAKLANTQREFIDALMNCGKLQPATIISACTFTLNASSNQPADIQINAALAAVNAAIATANASTAGTTFRNHENGHVINLQRQYVDLCMNIGRIPAATILSTCGYST